MKMALTASGVVTIIVAIADGDETVNPFILNDYYVDIQTLTKAMSYLFRRFKSTTHPYAQNLGL